MKKFFWLVITAVLSAAPFASANTNSLYVSAIVSPILQIQADSANEFSILDSNGNLIPSKELGNVVVKSNYATWKLLIDSSYEASSSLGRLKLEGGDIYIPYTFAIRNGDVLVLDRFNVKSDSQSITPVEGRGYSLVLYFTDDDTLWPQGTYSDTLVFTVTTD